MRQDIVSRHGIRPVGLLLLMLSLLALAGCDEEVEVRQTTVVFADGALERSVEIWGRTGSRERPSEPGWLRSKAGIRLADPEAWRVTDRSPGHLAAEARFFEVAAVPPTLAHETDLGIVFDRGEISLQRLDLVIMTHTRYVERVGDPFDRADLSAALDGLADWAAERFAEQLDREFGGAVDPSPGQAFLRGEARRLSGELFGEGSTSGPLIDRAEDDPQVAQELARVLERYGVSPGRPAAGDEGAFDADRLLERLLDWSRAGVAATLRERDGSGLTAESLDFWPDLEQVSDAFSLAFESESEIPPHLEEFGRMARTLLQSISGYYGDGSVPDFHFEYRVELPGQLIRTSGTPVDEGVVWYLQNDAMKRGATLSVETVELHRDALVRLGARRDLETEELVRLVRWLGDEETGEGLRELLGRAVDAGALEILADEELDGPLKDPAHALLEMLDPTLPRWPPRG